MKHSNDLFDCIQQLSNVSRIDEVTDKYVQNVTGNYFYEINSCNINQIEIFLTQELIYRIIIHIHKNKILISDLINWLSKKPIINNNLFDEETVFIFNHTQERIAKIVAIHEGLLFPANFETTVDKIQIEYKSI